ncbi:MAG: uracil phosphoribosyltransferase [Sandaracinaceae bacterium]|nr:uracil phosphoribosyltransferase [Sandaracinaceae bacterium]MCC6876040.1 uracil phosphoribosyltransferase [Sandaracinaceae bacterium]
MPGEVTVIAHPLIQHKLTLMRNKETSTSKFRQLLEEISMLMGYEVTRDMPVVTQPIETPVTSMVAPVLEGKKVVIVSVLRAGDGILNGILRILPSARIGHIGLYRDPKTLQAIEYYFKVPGELGDRDAIVCDPMLATGHSAIAAVDRIKALGPRSIKFLCLLTCPEGIGAFHTAHPDVPIFCASIDEKLNEKGYIVPGLGDAGDRLFGTK